MGMITNYCLVMAKTGSGVCAPKLHLIPGSPSLFYNGYFFVQNLIIYM